jgi:prephenate dehydratase
MGWESTLTLKAPASGMVAPRRKAPDPKAAIVFSDDQGDRPNFILLPIILITTRPLGHYCQAKPITYYWGTMALVAKLVNALIKLRLIMGTTAYRLTIEPIGQYCTATMTVTIAYLGPEGTYSQLAALAYSLEFEKQWSQPVQLQAFPSIPKAMQATATGLTNLTLVPVENSIEGGVTTTLDTLWRLSQLKIHHALVMPIRHGFLSYAKDLQKIDKVYSHPQALSQCQIWLEQQVPQATLVPTRSTTEALQHLSHNPSIAAISSEWAAQLYSLPILVHDINDHIDNCTKFWVLGRPDSCYRPHRGAYTSLAFTLPVNAPGALLKPLQVFADYAINLSRIESRPAKRALGDYLFFVDLEAGDHASAIDRAIQEMENCTESLMSFGSYDLLAIEGDLTTAKARSAEIESSQPT